MSRVDWKTVKGIKGLQVRLYSATEKAYRLKQSVNSRIVIDHFGVMTESEAQKIMAELKANRETGIGPQTYKEMISDFTEQEKAEYITKKEETKRIIAQDNFNRLNSIAYFFDSIFYPHRSTYGSKSGIKKAEQNFNNCWRSTIGHIPITELKYTHMETVLKSLEAQGKSPQTIKHMYNLIQAMYNYAKVYFSAHYSIALPDFCGKIIKLPKVNNEKVGFLNYSEANILLEALYNYKSKNGRKDGFAMAVLALYSGLRFGDITRLKWRDLESSIGYAHTPKGGLSYGVHLNVKPIKEMIEERKSFFPHRQPEEFVFLNQYNEQFTETPKLFERTIKKLGFNETPQRKGDKYQKITFHSLRHTFASWLAIEGVNLYAICSLMGHSDIKMTQRYAKLSKEYTEKHVAQIAHHYQSQNILDV